MRFVAPFEVLERITKVAYQLALPTSIYHIHNVFYMSLLCKYISDPTHMLSVKDVELENNMIYEEGSI